MFFSWRLFFCKEIFRNLYFFIVIIFLMMIPSYVKAQTLLQQYTSSTVSRSLESSPPTVSLVVARIFSSTPKIEPAVPFQLSVEFTIQPGWHIYAKEPGDIGLPTQVKWSVPEGFHVGELEWPTANRIVDSAGFVSYGYQNKVILSSKITPPQVLTAPILVFGAQTQWLACKDTCIPGEAELSLSLPSSLTNIVASDVSENTTAHTISKTMFHRSLFHYLFLALIGGIILNIMPCVLPVLSIKIMSFIRQSEEKHTTPFRLGLAYLAGVVISFEILAGIIILMRIAGTQIGWGFQFQSPRFVIMMCALMVVFGLSLFGVFSIGLPRTAVGGIERISRKEGIGGVFLGGVFATLLSTPCMAPFLGAAIGYALTRPAWVTLLLFGVVGIGLASPYVILARFPGWMRWIPKPGPWMISFQQLMGFWMMAAAIWLLSVLAQQLPARPFDASLIFFLVIALACWIVGKVRVYEAFHPKWIFWILISMGLVVSGYWFLERALGQVELTNSLEFRNGEEVWENGIQWLQFEPGLAEKLASEGRTVFVDFTSQWCPTCKANEFWVLSRQVVGDAFKKLDVVAIKADWTIRNQAITNELAKYGMSGVPLYLVFYPWKPNTPRILPTLLTSDRVVNALVPSE